MPFGFSRRALIRGSALATVGTTMFDATSAFTAPSASPTPENPAAGPATVAITLQINGKMRTAQVEARNQYHAIFDNALCAIVHPSTAATSLVALDATVELSDARSAVRQLPLEQFFIAPVRNVQRENDLRPQEILSAIRLPKLPSNVRMAHIKQGEKDSFDWSLADVAVVLDMAPDGACRRASVVLGAAAPVPHRARAAEAALAGKRIDETTAAQAARAALEGATPLSKNAYKIPLFEALVRRTILKAVAPA